MSTLEVIAVIAAVLALPIMVVLDWLISQPYEWLIKRRMEREHEAYWANKKDEPTSSWYS